MCLSVQAVTFELLHIETSFLACRYIFTISRLSLSNKVIRSRSYEKNDNFTYFKIVKADWKLSCKRTFYHILKKTVRLILH